DAAHARRFAPCLPGRGHGDLLRRRELWRASPCPEHARSRSRKPRLAWQSGLPGGGCAGILRSTPVGAHPGATDRRSRPSALLRGSRGTACMSRIQRIFAWGLFSLVLLVASGWLLADHLTPRAFGVPSHTLPLQ